MRTLIIFNPTAGRRHIRCLRRYVACLRAGQASVTLVATSHAGHGRTLAYSEAHEDQFTHIVGAGGDGTVAEIADGLSGTDKIMGILPLGTANVFAHELGLSFDPETNARLLLSNRNETIWPGLMRVGVAERLFLQMVGAGFDAHVVQNISLPLKRRFGRGAYVFQTIREATRYDFPKFCVTLDGQTRETFGLIVSKGRFYGGRYCLARDATPSEQGFWVTMLNRPGARFAGKAALGLLFGRVAGIVGVEQCRASRIEICGTRHLSIQADGDAVGHTPLVITDAVHPLHIVR